MNKEIEKLMKILNITEQEALELQAYDKAVDKGEKTEYDLTKEQEKEIKKYVNVTEHKTTEKKERKPKENPEKEQIIKDLANFLTENGLELEITNKSREISFKKGSNSYKLTLTATRK